MFPGPGDGTGADPRPGYPAFFVIVALYVPDPQSFFARTRNWYVAPFVSPVTVALRVVRTPSAKVFQVVVPFLRYWTT